MEAHMQRSFRTLAAALVVAAPATAAADTVLVVEFQERATGDSFRVENVAPCPGIMVEEVSIDLGTAEGELFFDTAPGGAGYADEPTGGVDILRGGEYVAATSRLDDGGEVVTLTLRDFGPGAEFRFALDVDDAEGPVPGPDDDASAREMAGAAVAVKMVNSHGFRRAEVRAFNERANAPVAWKRACIEIEEESEIDVEPLDTN
jgi:hypothetical protein